MRVLVTGATGQVGAAVVRHFLQKGDEVVGLVRHIPGGVQEVRWLQTDIGDWDLVQQAITRLDGCDVVVHAAAEIKPNLNPAEYTTINALGTVHMLEAARRWGASQFVYISGLNVLGQPRQIPVDESHPIGPTTAYGLSKYYGEGIALQADNGVMKTIALRVSSPVGPGSRLDRIFGIFVRRALNGESLVLNGRGRRRQNYVDVRDVAAAVDKAIKNQARGLYNLGGAHDLSNHELALACARTLRSSSVITYSGEPDPDEQVVWEISSQKARKNFGYVPKVTIEDSIRTYADML